MEFVKKILIYGIGNILNKLIIFVMLPIYTNNFTPTDYGDNDLAITTAMMLSSLVFMEIWTALLRFCYDEKEVYGKNRVFSNVIAIMLILSPLYVCVSILVAIWQHIPNVGWMLAYGFTLMAFSTAQFMCRGLGKTSYFITSGIISSVIQVLLSYIFVYVFHFGAECMLIAPVIGNIFAIVFLQVKLKLSKRFHFESISLKYLKSLIKYSLPLSINAVAYWSMTNMSRYIARNKLGSEVNGYISVAMKFINVVTLIVSIYSLAWQESAYEHSNDSDRGTYYSYMFSIYLDLMFIFTSIIIIGVDLIYPYIIGEQYEPARLLLPIYFISSLVNSFSTFLGYIFSAEKKTGSLVYSTVIGATVNIGMLYFTINHIGVISIPLSLIMGMLINVFSRVIIIRKYIILTVHIKKLIINSLFLIFSCILVFCNVQIFIRITYICFTFFYCIFIYKNYLNTIFNQIRNKII